MPGIDEARTFLPVNIAILTISDTRDLAGDRSGQALVDLLQAAGHKLAARNIVRDEQSAIVTQLKIGRAHV